MATVHYTDFHPQSGLLRKVAGFVLPVDGDLTPERDTLSPPPGEQNALRNHVYRRRFTIFRSPLRRG